MLHKISMILILLATTACMKLKKKGDDETANATPAVQAESQTTDGFDFDYDSSDEKNQIVFKIPESWGSTLVVNKSKGSEKIFQRTIAVSKHQLWKDIFEDDAKITYQFFQKDGDQLIALKEIEVLPAFDLTVSEDFKLDEKYAITNKVQKIYFRRLEIQNGAKVFIGDFRGQIQIDQLKSEDGALQTFPFDARAVSGAGRAAGGFALAIQSGEGALNLNLIAESGANGKDGADPDASLIGATGTEGSPGQFIQQAASVCPHEQMCIAPPPYDCVGLPDSGGVGGRGLRGHHGENGENGGSVQKISVMAPTTVIIHTQKVPGQKGLGGHGGAGGDGGRGGQGGDGGLRGLKIALKLNPDFPALLVGISKTCPSGKEGPSGPPGEVGVDGHDGRDGVID